MKNILITGATGNVGFEVIKSLQKLNKTDKIIAGVRDLVKDKAKFEGLNIEFLAFDFANSTTYQNALKNIDYLFLLRPPQLSEVGKYFEPFIKIAQECGVNILYFCRCKGLKRAVLFLIIKLKNLLSKVEFPSHSYALPILCRIFPLLCDKTWLLKT